MAVLTDYQNERAGIEKDIAELCSRAGKAPLDTEQTTRLAYRLYQRASLSGRLDEFEAAAEAIEGGLARVGPWPDLCLLKANLDFKFHRIAETKRSLDMSPGLAASFPGRVLAADIHMQEGRYEEARRALEALIEEDRTWDNLARIAYWKSKFGTLAEAEQLYAEAEEEITAKEMRSYAWVQLQRGLICLRNGRYSEAAAYYRRADNAYSGYWLVSDHTAELLGAEGKFEEAIELYESVLECTPRPELQQAFGELYSAMGREQEADEWFDRALEGYLESARSGGVHYYHHLVDFFSDVRESGAEAVGWARRDHDLRQNFATEAALAWALYRDGQVSSAVETMDRALESGVSDAHLFAKAAEINAAASRTEKSKELCRRACAMNPHYQSFHVHRG